MFTVILFSIALVLSVESRGSDLVSGPSTPEQIHIAVSDNADEMSFTWVTPENVTSAMVIYGPADGNFTEKVLAFSTNQHYVFGNYLSGAIHSALATGLNPDSWYFYKVGSDGGDFSDTYSFSTFRNYPISILVTGDIGDVDESQVVIGKMNEFSKDNLYDYVVHSGDLSYANGNETIWDDWSNNIQPLAAHIPYMVSVGNHETEKTIGWVAFLSRFNMPAQESGATEGNLYYSYNYGPIHMIALSSEMKDFSHSTAQYKWLEQDLANVDREQTPWIFTTWHRPFYCSNTHHYQDNEKMRKSFEDLFYEYKVDIHFTGHIHAYERTKPMYNWTVVPDGIVTLVVGNGGNGEGLAKEWRDPQPDWSVYREASYGFASLTVYNSSVLHWQMIRADDGSIADDWWFVRNH